MKRIGALLAPCQRLPEMVKRVIFGARTGIVMAMSRLPSLRAHAAPRALPLLLLASALVACETPHAGGRLLSVDPGVGPAPTTMIATVATAEPASAIPDPSSATPLSSAAATSPSLAEPRDDIPGLPNFAKISDALYRGAQPTAEGFQALAKMGVKTVVNLRMLHSDRDLLKGTGLKYLHIKAKAWHPEDEDVASVLKVIEDPANQPVFVHCQHGADRTGTMVAAYRIVEQGMSSEDAAQELPRFHYHPIWSQVMTYLGGFQRDAMRARIAKTAMPRLEIIE